MSDAGDSKEESKEADVKAILKGDSHGRRSVVMPQNLKGSVNVCITATSQSSTTKWLLVKQHNCPEETS
jgi:hypothetical protein